MIEQRLAVLERQVLSLRRQVQRNEEWLDTISSSILKRAWWVLCGYRFHRVGRWYAKTEDLRSVNGLDNTATLVAFDARQPVDSHRLTSDDPASSQALAFEFMRRLGLDGFTVQSYNDGSDAAWQDLVRTVVAGLGGKVAALTWPDQLAAANLGGNYFEHGHDFIVALTSPENRTTVTKLGPV